MHAIALFLALTAGAQSPAEGPPLVPYERLSARAGPPLVLLPAPASPWAVAQLHVRLAGEGIPAELRARGEQLAEALAAGRLEGQAAPLSARISEVGGETRFHVDEDEIVLSVGVPAASLPLALDALAARLRGRRRLLPAAPGDPIARLPAPPRAPLVVRQLLAPAHPYAQPVVSADLPEAAPLRELADRLLRRDGVAFVVVAPLPDARSRAAVSRALGNGLPPGAAALARLSPPAGSRIVEDVTLPGLARGPFSWLWWQTPGLADEAPARRAAFAVLAQLLGAQVGTGGAAGWISWHAPLLDPAQAEASERARLARLEALAAAPVDDETLRRARLAVRTEALFAFAHPESAALALGAAELLGGDAGGALAAVLALDEITSAEVTLAARSLVAGPRLGVRGQGAP